MDVIDAKEEHIEMIEEDDIETFRGRVIETYEYPDGNPLPRGVRVAFPSKLDEGTYKLIKVVDDEK